MTESEWLTCADPGEMYNLVGDAIGDRRLRLFGCDCVRGVWNDLPVQSLRDAIETCERIADGTATVEELRAAKGTADAAYEGIGDIIADHSAIAVAALCQPKPSFSMGGGSSAGIAAVAAEAWSGDELSFDAAWEKAKQAHSHLLRDIVGNPFRRSRRERIRVTPDVIGAAKAIYGEPELPSGYLNNKRLAALGDKLKKAGCTDADILEHCREPGPHVRGCWVVDLVLGKE
jgi:hypothetical protein